MKPPRIRTDWFRVIADLNREGYSMMRISRVLDIPFSTIKGWREGSEPPHCLGCELLELWREVTGLAAFDQPRTCD